MKPAADDPCQVAVRAGEYADVSHLGELPDRIVALIRDGLEARGRW